MKTICSSLLFALIFLTTSTSCKKEDPDPFEKDSGVFTDTRDQEKYNWVRIGDQIWMAENLAFDAGDNCWVYYNDEINVVTMGRLYTWEAAQDACPDGWHLPTDIEWEEMAYEVSLKKGPYSKVEGGDDWLDLGIHLKAATGWINDSYGTDDFGFNAQATGARSYNTDYFHKGEYVYWWSSSSASEVNAWFRYMSYYNHHFLRDFLNKNYAFSVRCIKD